MVKSQEIYTITRLQSTSVNASSKGEQWAGTGVYSVEIQNTKRCQCRKEQREWTLDSELEEDSLQGADV